MKKLLALSILISSLVLGFVTPTLSADSPLFKMGDDISVYLNVGLDGRYNSNLFSDTNNKKEDYILILSPGVEIIGGNPSTRSGVKFYFREDIYFHHRNPRADRQDANFHVTGSYVSARLSARATGFFNEVTQNVPSANLVGALVESNQYGGDAHFAYTLSPKTTFEAGAGARHTDYRSRGLIDYTVYSFPFDLYYRYSPKLEFGPSYRMRHTDVNSGRDSNDHFVGLAVRGELASKLNAEIHLGAQHRNKSGLSDRTTFSSNTVIKWAATTKFDLVGYFDKDFVTGGIGQSIENTGGRVAAFYKYCPSIALDAYFSYNDADYQNSLRKDKTTKTAGVIRYLPNSYVNFSVGYSYINNDSNVFGSSYNGHIVDLTASLRY